MGEPNAESGPLSQASEGISFEEEARVLAAEASAGLEVLQVLKGASAAETVAGKETSLDEAVSRTAADVLRAAWTESPWTGELDSQYHPL